MRLPETDDKAIRRHVVFPDGNAVAVSTTTNRKLNAHDQPNDPETNEDPTMNEDKQESKQTVFTTEEERNGAKEYLRESMAIEAAHVEEMVSRLAADPDRDEDEDEVLYLAARSEGWQPDGCDHDEPACEHTLAALGHRPDDDATTTNATGTALPPEDDPMYYDGGRPIPESKTDDVTANYGAVPGQFDRDLDVRTNAEDTDAPAGGRTAWERRRAGLDEVPEDDDLPPAGGRQAWEDNRENREPRYPLSIRWRDEDRQQRRERRERALEAERRAAARRRQEREGLR